MTDAIKGILRLIFGMPSNRVDDMMKTTFTFRVQVDMEKARQRISEMLEAKYPSSKGDPQMDDLRLRYLALFRAACKCDGLFDAHEVMGGPEAEWVFDVPAGQLPQKVAPLEEDAKNVASRALAVVEEAINKAAPFSTIGSENWTNPKQWR